MARGTDALRRQATCLPGTDSTDCRRTLATPQADLPATTLTLWSTDYHTGLISDLKHFFRTAVAPKLGDHVRIEWLDRSFSSYCALQRPNTCATRGTLPWLTRDMMWRNCPTQRAYQHGV